MRIRRLSTLTALSLLVSAMGSMSLTDAAHAGSPRLSRAAHPTYQTNGRVAAVIIVGNTVYVGGEFTAVRPPRAPAGTQEVRRDHLAAFRLDTGALRRWRPHTNGTVEALAASPDGRRIYVGGSFTRMSGAHRHHFGAVDADGRGEVAHLRANTNGSVLAIATHRHRVYLGGAFTRVKHRSRIRLAALDTSRHLLRHWRPRANSTVRSIAVSRHGRVTYVGGAFSTINGKPDAHLAKLSGTGRGKVQRWKHHPTYPVWAIVPTRHFVFVGGNGPGGRVGAYGPGGRSLWSVQTDGGVQALAMYDGALLVGGHFRNVCAGVSPGPQGGYRCSQVRAPRAHLLALNRKTGALKSWNPRANSGLGVFALAATASRVYAGGTFTEIDNRPQQGLAEFRRR